MSKKLKLGYKISNPEPALAKSDNDGDEMMYPSMHLNDVKGLDKFPDEGHAIVKYKVRSRSTHLDDKGNKRHSASIDIHSMEHHEPPKKSDNTSFAAKHAMEDLMAG